MFSSAMKTYFQQFRSENVISLVKISNKLVRGETTLFYSAINIHNILPKYTIQQTKHTRYSKQRTGIQ